MAVNDRQSQSGLDHNVRIADLANDLPNLGNLSESAAAINHRLRVQALAQLSASPAQLHGRTGASRGFDWRGPPDRPSLSLMTMRPILLALLTASPAFAGDWRPLDEAAITAALNARMLQYQDGATQHFFTDGRTLYRVETGDSWGKWWAEGDRYCSTWPPSETPSCYAVELQGIDIRFTGAQGDVTIGRYVDL